MSAETDIYSFEQIFEDALKAVFTAREVKAFTSQDTPDFQKDRPRVEVVFIPGPSQGQYKTVGGNFRQTSWKGQFQLRLVTEASAQVHNAFRAVIRSIMHGVGAAINETPPMDKHKLQPFFADAGTSPRYQPEEGTYETNMIFECDFSVQNSAWAALAA